MKVKELKEMDNSYVEKLRRLTDYELEIELQNVIDRLNDGYARLKGKSVFNLLVEASIKLCNEAIYAIKKEKENRNINSRKA